LTILNNRSEERRKVSKLMHLDFENMDTCGLKNLSKNPKIEKSKDIAG